MGLRVRQRSYLAVKACLIHHTWGRARRSCSNRATSRGALPRHGADQPDDPARLSPLSFPPAAIFIAVPQASSHINSHHTSLEVMFDLAPHEDNTTSRVDLRGCQIGIITHPAGH